MHYLHKLFANHLILVALGVLSLGVGHSVMLKLDKSVWITGNNNYGQIGDGSKRNYIAQFEEVFSSGAKAVAAGGGHTMVVKQDGSVWAVGRNQLGQLGDSTNIDRKRFVQVFFQYAKVVAVAAGSRHTLLIEKNRGRVWATGSNAHGQLGEHGLQHDRNGFVMVFKQDAKAVAAGCEFSLVLKTDGSVWATGYNAHGQLGDGSTVSKFSYAPVFKAGAKAVAAGCQHTLVLKRDGNVWAAGKNSFGQLGYGSTRSSNSMRMVTHTVMHKSTGGLVAIAAGMDHSIVLGQDGSVWTAGRNNYGQLGDGSIFHQKTFVQVIPSGAQAVAAGGWHSMVIDEHGRVWAAGSNEYGQLGDGTGIDKSNFVVVMSSKNNGTWGTSP